MRGRLSIIALVGLLCAAVLLRGAGPGGAPPARPDTGRSLQAPDPILLPEPLPTPPARDIFRYADSGVDERTLEARSGEGQERARPAPVPTPAVRPIRLVGLVRRGDALQAALATSDGVFLVGPGEAIDGFGVLFIDEDQGVRLRDREGEEFTLAPPD